MANILVGGISASRTQRRSSLALMPRASATDAIDMPGCDAAATASALNSSLCRRRRRRPANGNAPIVSTCPPRVQVDTSILCSYAPFKMTSPDAYWRACARCRATPTTGTPWTARSSSSASWRARHRRWCWWTAATPAFRPACTRLLVSHTRRLPKHQKKLLKLRQLVEPMVVHMKTDGLLDRNWLKGALGDPMHAVLRGAGHNLRMILAHLRVQCYALVGPLMLALMLLSRRRVRCWHRPRAEVGLFRTD